MSEENEYHGKPVKTYSDEKNSRKSESALSDLLNNGEPTIEGYFWFKSDIGQFAEWEVVLVTKQTTGRLFMNRICSTRGYALDEIEQHFKRCKFGLKVTEPVI